ncbi:MAG: 4-(cytidine 5'-diphospho)-2-C-methyl-D-erythritol kinase [Alphaproteobacteria bacterium]
MAADPAPPRIVREAAPAKVNLYLHVVGRRADGYHLVDSLVAFAAIGDSIEAKPAPGLSLAIDGPFAGDAPADGTNLVLAAAERLRAAAGGGGAAIRLTKRLPVAAGIGGGSADAAAALRALRRLWRPRGGIDLRPLAGAIGADVPMCLARRPARIAGIGEVVTPVPAFPMLPAVLVNPGVPLATADVFRGRAGTFGAPAPALPAWRDAADLVAWLEPLRNDLTETAVRLVPAVGEALRALAGAEGCRLARMSGSGATCLGLFDTMRAARLAARRIRRHQPRWWVKSTTLAAAREPRVED